MTTDNNDTIVPDGAFDGGTPEVGEVWQEADGTLLVAMDDHGHYWAAFLTQDPVPITAPLIELPLRRMFDWRGNYVGPPAPATPPRPRFLDID